MCVCEGSSEVLLLQAFQLSSCQPCVSLHAGAALRVVGHTGPGPCAFLYVTFHARDRRHQAVYYYTVREPRGGGCLQEGKRENDSGEHPRVTSQSQRNREGGRLLGRSGQHRDCLLCDSRYLGGGGSSVYTQAKTRRSAKLVFA